MTASGWRARDLVRESTANVFDPRSRHALAVAAAAVLGLLLAFTLVLEWRHLDRDLAALRADGRHIVILTGSDRDAPAAIGVRSCSALAALPGVVRAGSVQFGSARTFLQLGPLVPVTEVSTDLLPELARHEAVVGSGLASSPGPLTLSVAGGQTLDAFVAAPEPSGMAGLNTSVAIPLSGVRTSTDTCVVELSAFADLDRAVPALTAALETTGGDVIGAPVLRESYDVLGAYRARALRFLPIVVGFAGGALSIVLLRTRSSELAAYRLSGTRRADLAALLLWEQIATAGVFVVAGGVGLLLQSVLDLPVQADDPLWVWVAGLAWVGVAGAVAVFGLRGSPADLARDR